MNVLDDIETRVDKLLVDPELLNKLINEIGKKVPRQERQKKICILAIASTKVINKHEHIHLLINSSSSAGKSYLMKVVSKLQDVCEYEYRTRISGKALNYWHNAKFEPDWTWDGKMLYLEDIGQDVLDSDAFKVMMTEGSSAIIVKDGRAIEININGHPSIMATMAEHIPKNEILNRFIIITLDESAEQNELIYNKIAEEWDGASEENSIDIEYKRLFCKLKNVAVNIPFSKELAKRFDRNETRGRRDFGRLLTLISASAALYQYQRQRDNNDKVIATKEDFFVALDLFSYINPANVTLDLTFAQKKAYDNLLELLNRYEYLLPRWRSVAHGGDLLDSPLRSPPSIPEAQTCECGSGAFTRECIYNHYSNRDLRNWDRILERLAAKRCIKLYTAINPHTKRTITVYIPQRISAMNDTLNIFSEDSTTYNNNINNSGDVGGDFNNNNDVKVKNSHHAPPKTFCKEESIEKVT
jgi:hypothetical protein